MNENTARRHRRTSSSTHLRDRIQPCYHALGIDVNQPVIEYDENDHDDMIGEITEEMYQRWLKSLKHL